MPISASNLLLCNYVYEDPVSHNVTLLGLFTELRATKFPTPYRSMMLYLLLDGEPGEVGDLIVSCVSESTGEICLEQSMRVQIGIRGWRHVRFWLDDVRFPAPDSYCFAAKFDGQTVAERTIFVGEP